MVKMMKECEFWSWEFGHIDYISEDLSHVSSLVCVSWNGHVGHFGLGLHMFDSQIVLIVVWIAEINLNDEIKPI